MEGRADEPAAATQRRLRALREAARPVPRVRVATADARRPSGRRSPFGTCQKCRKTVTNPLTHICAPRSDFRRRKAAHDKQQRDRDRKKRQQQNHDYTACSDGDCKRALCVAYKTGWKGGAEAEHERAWQQGEQAGYDRGWAACYPVAFEAGIAACPRDHK